MNRRQFLGSVVGFALAGCGSPKNRSGPFAGQSLNVFVYAGGHEKTMREVFVPRFEQLTGASVILHAGWWDGIPKLKTSPMDDPPYDLLITDATQGYPAIRDGLFQQLDRKNIPNAENMVPSARDNAVYRDSYGITYPDSVMTLAYNRWSVPEAPTKWGDLLRPDLKNKLGFYSSFYLSLYTFACIKADVDAKPGTAQEMIRTDFAGVLKFAREHRSHVKKWWKTSTDMILDLVNEDVAAGNMHSPEYIAAMQEKLALAACIPEQDRAFVQVFWAIPVGTKKKELAELAINAIFSEEMQLEFARRGSATAIPSVAVKMAAEAPSWKALYPHTEAMFRTLRYYPYEVYAEHWDEIADIWDRTVLVNG